MNLTREQQEIIDFEDNLIIKAGAGAGKTSTLIEYAKKRPFNTFLYLAYNTKIKEEANKKFFGNTNVHTIHSLAYQEIGKYFNIKENLTIFDIANYFKFDLNNQENLLIVGNVLNQLELFFHSAKFQLIDLAKKYWDAMVNGQIPMTHDGYLKLYQLSEPELNYDYILIDEAQDSNEVMLDIVMKQKAIKIFVGDKYQNIYAYRNTINVFDKYTNITTKTLSQTFRFGESIAYIANKLIGDDFKIIPSNITDQLFINKELPYIVLTRTNSHLIDLLYQESLNNKKLFIYGSFKEIRNLILNGYYLYTGDLFKITDYNFKKMLSFENLKKMAKQDQEYKFLVKVIEKYQHLIPDVLDTIQRQLVPKEYLTDITFSTVHKVKGLEFEQVKLANDFFKMKNISREELNIYYVAVTRAKIGLEINDELINFI